MTGELVPVLLALALLVLPWFTVLVIAEPAVAAETALVAVATRVRVTINRDVDVTRRGSRSGLIQFFFSVDIRLTK